MIDIPPYPLQWPEMMPRHKGPRETGAFKTTLPAALDNAEKSIARFSADVGNAISKNDIVFSSNVGGLGRGQPDDPGVALWFMWDGFLRCVAVDRYSKVEANLQAIHHIIEADRTKIRHGSLAIVKAQYSGLIGIPHMPGPTHWEILGIKETTVKEVITAAYRQKAKELQEVGAPEARLVELNLARDKAMKEIAG